jgi:group I intron endonuclease
MYLINKYMNEKIICIYSIKNVVNGHFYIGSAINLKSRLKKHFNLLRNKKHHSIRLQRAFDKYGEKSFKVDIIEHINDSNVLIQREQYWINFLNPEYNMTKIAGKNCHLGMKRSQETKDRISKSLLGRRLSEEHKQSVSNTLSGRELPEEHKQNIRNGLNKSEKFKNAIHSEERNNKIRNTRIKNGGYVILEETRKKISETLKSKHLITKNCRQIAQYDLYGNLIKAYSSMARVDKEFNLAYGTTCGRLQRKVSIHPLYIFKIIERDEYESKKSRKIVE